MIEKLFKLYKLQTDQKLAFRAEIQGSINQFDNQINELKHNIATATVDKYGAISDFTILEIHKETLRIKAREKEGQKKILINRLEKLNVEIVELQKDVEKYDYLLKEEKKEKYKQILIAEDQAADEFMQSKYINLNH